MHLFMLVDWNMEREEVNGSCETRGRWEEAAVTQDDHGGDCDSCDTL